jgi:hypothetical protein
MGFFTKEVEKELMNVLPNDKPVLMIRGKLEGIKYTRGKRGVEPVLIVSQSKHKYSIHCKEGIPPKDIKRTFMQLKMLELILNSFQYYQRIIKENKQFHL